MTSPYPEAVLPRNPLARALALLIVVVLTTAGLSAPVEAKAKDPRTTRGLFVDRLMPAAKQDAVYARSIGRTPQALWIVPEAYPTSRVARVVRAYTSRAVKARKTPTLSIYGIPDRDCGMYSSGGLPGATSYKRWIKQVARGLKAQRALVVLEPDAIPFYGDPRCENASGRL